LRRVDDETQRWRNSAAELESQLATQGRGMEELESQLARARASEPAKSTDTLGRRI
jgi:uncharacterized coiled-coil protein SlyX